ATDALDRGAREQLPEARVVEREQFGEARGDELGAREERAVAGGRPRELVPWADREAVVAAVDAVADGGAELLRDRPLVLDRQVRDAAPCIEPVGRGEGVGRAGVLARAARAAAVGMRPVGCERQRRVDRA